MPSTQQVYTWILNVKTPHFIPSTHFPALQSKLHTPNNLFCKLHTSHSALCLPTCHPQHFTLRTPHFITVLQARFFSDVYCKVCGVGWTEFSDNAAPSCSWEGRMNVPETWLGCLVHMAPLPAFHWNALWMCLCVAKETGWIIAAVVTRAVLLEMWTSTMRGRWKILESC